MKTVLSMIGIILVFVAGALAASGAPLVGIIVGGIGGALIGHATEIG